MLFVAPCRLMRRDVLVSALSERDPPRLLEDPLLLRLALSLERIETLTELRDRAPGLHPRFGERQFAQRAEPEILRLAGDRVSQDP